MADNNLTTAPVDEQDVITTSQPALGIDGPEVASVATGAGVKRPGDRVFEFLSTASATLITVMIAAIAAFLIWRAQFLRSTSMRADSWDSLPTVSVGKPTTPTQ